MWIVPFVIWLVVSLALAQISKSLLAAWFVASGGAAVAAAGMLASELRTRRKAVDFVFRIIPIAEMERQALKQLEEYARQVRHAAEKKIVFQRRGAEGLVEYAGDYYALRNHEWLIRELDSVFALEQADFYHFYDHLYAVIEALRLDLQLKERNWKKYAGEPELPSRPVKAEAS